MVVGCHDRAVEVDIRGRGAGRGEQWGATGEEGRHLKMGWVLLLDAVEEKERRER